MAKSLRTLARGATCVRCGRDDGTVVGCHYTGPRQHVYGKGKGCKGSDAVMAELCLECHDYFDKYESGNTWERSEEFLHCVALTWIRWYANGRISVAT